MVAKDLSKGIALRAWAEKQVELRAQTPMLVKDGPDGPNDPDRPGGLWEFVAVEELGYSKLVNLSDEQFRAYGQALRAYRSNWARYAKPAIWREFNQAKQLRSSDPLS